MSVNILLNERVRGGVSKGKDEEVGRGQIIEALKMHDKNMQLVLRHWGYIKVLGRRVTKISLYLKIF